MKKGFTLIELLAVIVILAIIALIATPIVLNIISESKESSQLRSTEFYLDAVEYGVAKKIMDEPTFKPSSCEIQSNGNLKCGETNVKVEISGEVPKEGKICVSDKGTVSKVMVKYNNYYVSYDGKETKTSDKETFDSFSCSGTGSVIYEDNIEFKEEYGYLALPSKCFDNSLFELGKYYNIILTDESGNSYTHKLVAQNSSAGIKDDNYSFALSSPKNLLSYLYFASEDICYLGMNEDVPIDDKYKGKYKIQIAEDSEEVEPKYVLRLMKYYRNSYYSTLEFISTDLKAGDKVTFEVTDPTYTTNNGIRVYSTTAAEYYDDGNIYNKLYFKFASKSVDGFNNIMDIKVIINDGEREYPFKKEDFKHVDNGDLIGVGLGCVYGTYFYAGNDDIDYVNGC